MHLVKFFYISKKIIEIFIQKRNNNIIKGEYIMKLKELRNKQRLSQRELSIELNIPEQTLYSWENQSRQPNIENLIKIADYYHITLDELVGRPTSIINKMLLNDRERSIIDKILSMNDKQQELTEFYIDTMMGNIQR